MAALLPSVLWPLYEVEFSPTAAQHSGPQTQTIPARPGRAFNGLKWTQQEAQWLFWSWLGCSLGTLCPCSQTFEPDSPHLPGWAPRGRQATTPFSWASLWQAALCSSTPETPPLSIYLKLASFRVGVGVGGVQSLAFVSMILRPTVQQPFHASRAHAVGPKSHHVGVQLWE